MTGKDSVDGQDQLLQIVEVARQLSRPFDLREVLEQIIDTGRDMLHADRASILLFDEEKNELYGAATSEREEFRFPATKGIAGETLATREIIRINDCYADPRFNPGIDKATGYRTNTMISVPLIGLDDEVVGILQALNAEEGSFTLGTERLADLFAGFAALAIQRAQAFQDRVQQEKQERELSLARDIQRALLPTHFPEVDGYEIYGWSRSAKEVGGDYFDLLQRPNGRIVAVLADVTGKGMPAALLVPVIHTAMRLLLGSTPAGTELMKQINAHIADASARNKFITLLMAELDPGSGSLDCVNAGHNPAFLIRADESVVEVKAGGMPLGLYAKSTYKKASLQMEPGDLFFIYSDGITEASSRDGEEFGEDRLVELLLTLRKRPLPEMVEVIDERVTRFAEGQEQGDDQTVVVIRCSET